LRAPFTVLLLSRDLRNSGTAMNDQISAGVALADHGEHEEEVFRRVAFSEEGGSLEHCHFMVGNFVSLADQIVVGELTPNLSLGRF